VPLFSAEEWKQAQKEKRTKQRLSHRQRWLMQKLRRNLSKFRSDPKIQLELRRVAALCTKMDVHLNSALNDEIVRRVMES
jgi:hypothetical protein